MSLILNCISHIVQEAEPDQDDFNDDDDDDDGACVSVQADASPQENGACVDHGQ